MGINDDPNDEHDTTARAMQPHYFYFLQEVTTARTCYHQAFQCRRHANQVCISMYRPNSSVYMNMVHTDEEAPYSPVQKEIDGQRTF